MPFGVSFLRNAYELTALLGTRRAVCRVFTRFWPGALGDKASSLVCLFGVWAWFALAGCYGLIGSFALHGGPGNASAFSGVSCPGSSAVLIGLIACVAVQGRLCVPPT